MLKKVLFFILSIGIVSILNAEETPHSLILQASTSPEAKLVYSFNYKLPFMQGDSPLTENNNINFSLSAELTPISLNGLASAIWTPIAFIEISTGGRIGTGWNMNLFNGDIYGLGKTVAGADDTIKVVNTGGLQGKVFLGGAFQFDLAAIFPGDWNHVLFKTYHEINYAGFTGASRNESWVFENDDGDNINGFKYYANVLLGYQMPIFLNMIALLAEMELNLYDIPGKSAWGGDLAQWTFSGILNFVVHKQFEVALICQFQTRKNYNESDWKDVYHRKLTINRSNPLRLEFYRVAAVASYRF
jgi:hypothetical protein